MKIKHWIAAIPLSLAVSISAQAKDEKYAVGFQSSFPAWGISAKMDINDEIAAQAIIGPAGVLNTYAARGIYKFSEEKHFNTYGYGMLGFWSYEGIDGDFTSSTFGQTTTETVLGYGAGGGVEYNWQAFAPTLPPVWWNLEAGLGFINFDSVNYNLSAFMIGAGAHYRF